MKKFPNLIEDRQLLSKEVTIIIEGLPAPNFNTGKLDSYSLFHYDIKMYKRPSGDMYYIFNPKDDCTMYIMNCNRDFYNELKKEIELNDKIDIFETDDKDYIRIPTSYRHVEGMGGATVIIQ